MTIGRHDVQWFSELVLRLHAADTDRQVFAELLPEVHRKFGSIVSQAEESSWDLSAYRQHGMYGGWRPPPGYLPAIADHPLVVRLLTQRRRGTLHRAALTPWADFIRTQFYNVVCRPDGMKDQMLAVMRCDPGSVCCVGVNRDTEFTAGEHMLMEHVRQHVEACLTRVRRTDAAMVALPVAEIQISRNLRPLALPPQLRSLLSGYFPEWRLKRTADELPEALRRWIFASLTMLAGRPPEQPLNCFQVEAPHGKLWLRLFPQQPHGHTLRLTEEWRGSNPLELRKYGLTTRECEVLHWLMAGKRNHEIAAILGCARRTVEKHVENVMAKTRAGNRLGAVHVANAWLQSEGPF